MHNLSNEYFQGEYETGSNNESGYELSPEFGLGNEYSGESGYELSPEYEGSNQYENNFEIQSANELLEVSNEYEFGDWLKRLAQKGAGAALGFLNSPTGQQVVSSLGNIAQKTLPALGQRAGSWLGQRAGSFIGGNAGNQISQFGAQAGQQLGQMAADRVPSFVRFAGDALKNIANEINMGRQPQVTPAIVRAAARHYPIILKVKGTLYAKTMNNPNYQPPTSNEYSNEAAYEEEAGNYENELNEITEMELASELLAVKNDQELDMFLGGLFKKIGGAVSNFAKSGLGKTLGGVLKTVAGKALPILGGVLGSAIPIPGVGTMLGSALGSAAGNLFGLELEGLSGEDREFETARAYVRFAHDATRRAYRMRNMSPGLAARHALIRSARRYAPGLLRLRRSQYGYGSRYGSSYRGYRPSYPGYRNYGSGYNRYYAPPVPPITPYQGPANPQYQGPEQRNQGFRFDPWTGQPLGQPQPPQDPGNQNMNQPGADMGSAAGDMNAPGADMDPGAMNAGAANTNSEFENIFGEIW
jgi:hypothetical protein